MKNSSLTLPLFVFFFITIASAQTIPNFIPTDSLVAYYSFEGNADDASSNGFNGSIYGATLSTDRNGIMNQAYHFDGIDDFISVPHNSDLAIVGDLTMHAIFRSEGFNGSSFHQTILNKRSGGYWPYNMSICYENYAEKEIFSGRRSNNPSANDYKYSNTQITTNQWEVWTITIHSDTVKFYRNGLLEKIDYFSIAAIDVAADLSFGRNGINEGLPEFFNGDIDEIAIWSRALDSLEVNNIYNEIPLCSDSIIQQPLSNSFNSIPGIAYFVASHSDSSATFQWQQNNGSGWSDISNFGIYSGSNTDSLFLNGITTAMNGFGYRCIVNSCAKDTTDIALLTVIDNIGLNDNDVQTVIRPNPTNGILMVEGIDNFKFEIIDMLGRLFLQGISDGQIDVSHLRQGKYVLVIKTDSKEVRKLIIKN